MTLADIRAQFEADLTWRHDEIRHLRNQLFAVADSPTQNSLRKALVVLLYAHFEGFCGTCLGIYAQVINQSKLQRRNVHDCIAAGSLARLLNALCNSTAKAKEFKRKLPEDTGLHRFARHAEFAGALVDVLEEPVMLEVDEIIDLESNVSPIVLRKNLYRLGFDPGAFSAHDGALTQLLTARNQIAHGRREDSIDMAVLERLDRAVNAIETGLIALLIDAIANKRYSRDAA